MTTIDDTTVIELESPTVVMITRQERAAIKRMVRAQPRPPKPPRRPPVAPVEREPLSASAKLVRTGFAILGGLLLAFALNVTVVSQVQHLVSQQKLSDEFRSQLAAGTAPVSETTFDGHLVADGAPVAKIDIPEIGVHEVVSEGSSSDVLKSGPGHRRDTTLPGQRGISVLLGRAAAFGGPFGKLQQLAPGDRFTVTTGQGVQKFEVIGLRYAGDPAPAPPTSKQSRLIFQTARGIAFAPTGVAYIDAKLTSAVQEPGPRQTTSLSLPSHDSALASDVSTVWALVFALQLLVAIEIATVWALRRVGRRKTWVVVVPVLVLSMFFVSNQLVILLPNLL